MTPKSVTIIIDFCYTLNFYLSFNANLCLKYKINVLNMKIK